MIIEKLKLKNFRNYENLEVDFNKELNIIYGKNAQGKTNILEAIYFLATSKSHRTNYSKDLIRVGSNDAHINLTVFDEYEFNIDGYIIQNGKKRFAINKQPIKKLNELLGNIHVIMFSPEDLRLINDGPSARRRFIDIELSQLNTMYYYYLNMYHKLLKQRNAMLKNFECNESCFMQLDIWDKGLVDAGSKLIEYRENFINSINEIYHSRHFEISGNTENINLVYEKDVEINKYAEKLSKNRKRDIKFGSTGTGPHRDDLKFDLNGMDLRKFGSQGQKRTAALSLKLSEIELVVKKRGISPILLLDDVLSELDSIRQEYLIKNLKDVQVFLTCTGIEDFVKNKSLDSNIYAFEVSRGICKKVDFSI